ncbi:MAG: hypothetical protein ACLFPD_08660 [Desulfosudaceae bacterium]
MRIAVIHYHLKPGGVTTVIRRQINAARGSTDYIVITGESGPENFPADTAVVPGLGYDEPNPAAGNAPGEVAAAILDVITARWPDGCDLVHIHNPLLAKNRRLLRIIRELQKKGLRLFLQVHDFAEDGRPRHYFAKDPYPADCHWGVINSRDRDILLAAGADPGGVHLVPNAVNPFEESAPPGGQKGLALYPVRAIRRKNIGEALLLSLFFENIDQLAITLPPNSPADMPGYRSWQAFAANRDLPVIFEASTARDFHALVAAAACMISTSITEGFGFAFLEPWTAGKPLVGRKLPALCRDFESAGVDLAHLYTRLDIPTAWLPPGELAAKIDRAVTAACRAFNIPAEDKTRQWFTALADRDTVDFGLLDESLQQAVLSLLLDDAGCRRELAAGNPGLAFPAAAAAPERIAANNRAVRRDYAAGTAADRLTAAYRAVRDLPVRHRLDKQVILTRFFNPERFNLLQWGEYA